MAFLSSHRASSILGLCLEGRQLEGVALARSNGGFKITRAFRATLSLDPLTNESELVGREIRNHLDKNGIRLRDCVVGIPLAWALTQPTKVPEIPEADIPGFLRLEAERGFPYAPDDLSISSSRYKTTQGEQYALQVAIPKSHLALLEKALKAARLRPASFSLGITALKNSSENPADGLIVLSVSENGIDLEVAAKGSVAALRTLEGAIETVGQDRHIDANMITREIRITLGQLPKELRDSISRVEVFGRNDWTEPLVKEMIPLARDMGLLAGLGLPPHPLDPGAPDLNQGSSLAAYCLALRHLTRSSPHFEFLLPKESAWSQAATRFASRKVMYSGATAGAVGLVVGAAFLWQQWQLSALESQWQKIETRVKEVEGLQQQARKFRPWYDESWRSLRIIKKLVEAFPEDGSVSAKNVEIKELAEIICSGQARDNQALLRLLDRLRESTQISDLKIREVRGKSPLQFNFSFRWVEGSQP
jgi:hypothetical protein